MNQAICRGVRPRAGTAAPPRAAWSGRAKAARMTVPRAPDPGLARPSTPDGWAGPPAGHEATVPAVTGPAVTRPAFTRPAVTGPAVTGPAAVRAIRAIRAMAELA